MGHNHAQTRKSKDQSCFQIVCLIVLTGLPDKKKNPDLRANLDRFDAITFAPTKTEVIARTREIFPDDLYLIDLLAEGSVLPSLRTLIKARQMDSVETSRLA